MKKLALLAALLGLVALPALAQNKFIKEANSKVVEEAATREAAAKEAAAKERAATDAAATDAEAATSTAATTTAAPAGQGSETRPIATDAGAAQPAAGDDDEDAEDDEDEAAETTEDAEADPAR